MLRKFEISKNLEIQGLLDQRRSETSEMNDKIDKMNEDKNWLKQFPERKTQKLDLITELEISLQEKQMEYKKELTKQEKNFTVQRGNIEQKSQQEIEQEKEKALSMAKKGITNSEQTIRENAKLVEQLQLHQTEYEQLLSEKTEILDQNDTYKSQLDQNQTGISEYQSINHKQSVKLKKLKEKVEYLNNFIEKEVKNYDANIEKVREEQNNKINDYEYELKGLQDQLRKKVKEIKHIKGLSQMILDQRSDIEQFFLEALDQVREENYRARKNNMRDDGNQLKLPDISQRSHEHNNNSLNKSNQKIDISNLDQEDKERILRLVFSKMNNGVPPKPWRINFEDNEKSSIRNLRQSSIND